MDIVYGRNTDNYNYNVVIFSSGGTEYRKCVWYKKYSTYRIIRLVICTVPENSFIYFSYHNLKQ